MDSQLWEDRAFRALVNADAAMYEAVQASDGALRRHLSVCHADLVRDIGGLVGLRREWTYLWKTAQIGARIRSRAEGSR